MTRQVILGPKAERDIQAAYDWYESQQSGLGERWLSLLRDKLEFIRRFPDASPVLYRGIRRAVVSRFPYLVFYVVRPTRIVVLAVLHGSRSPEAWPRG
jgi:plasmid stabilization system protein ParE